MLSAGERPQPPYASTIVDSTVSKARIMPDLAANGTNGVTSSTPPKPTELQHIWIVTGPAGCGKSTVGNVLRTELGIPFLEGDDVSTQIYPGPEGTQHPTPNPKKHPIAPKPYPPKDIQPHN